MRTPGLILRKFRYYSKISDVGKLSRRYFVMNAFDGTLTILGIILGTYFAVGLSPRTIISSGIGACIAMGMSGFTGTFLTERAERKMSLIKMEKVMLKKMGGTIIEKSMNFASIYTAFIDGMAPIIATLICITPYLFFERGWIATPIAFRLSLFLAFSILLALGIYLGRISHENQWISGLRMFVIGVGVAIIVLIAERLMVGPARLPIP